MIFPTCLLFRDYKLYRIDRIPHTQGVMGRGSVCIRIHTRLMAPPLMLVRVAMPSIIPLMLIRVAMPSIIPLMLVRVAMPSIIPLMLVRVAMPSRISSSLAPAMSG